MRAFKPPAADSSEVYPQVAKSEYRLGIAFAVGPEGFDFADEILRYVGNRQRCVERDGERVFLRACLRLADACRAERLAERIHVVRLDRQPRSGGVSAERGEMFRASRQRIAYVVFLRCACGSFAVHEHANRHRRFEAFHQAGSHYSCHAGMDVLTIGFR